MNQNDVKMFGAIQDLCDAIQADLNKNYPGAKDNHYDISMGNRYFKVVRGMDPTRYNHSGTVVLFVDRTNGDILKPATYRSPAKGARGNMLTGLKEAIAKCDWSGAWLYKR